MITMPENYFQHFGMDVSFEVDQKVLKQKFLQLSKQYHPDFHSQSEASNQSEMLELSSYTNRAYKTLKNSDKRFKYVLELKGVLFEEGKQSIPQEFLMEMMDFNESLMDAQMEEDLEKLSSMKAELSEIRLKLKESIQPILDEYDHESISEDQLSILSDYYLKGKYLKRIEEKIGIEG